MKRRYFLTSVAALSVSGKTAFAHSDAEHDRRVGPSVVPPEQLPREVPFTKADKPGEIHVDPNQFALFWTLPNNRAIRYTVGIGREGLYESGEFYVARKQKWPRWTPTPAMIARDPDRYLRFAGGVPGGLKNPLGARALYLYQPGRGDTYLRIHGTTDPKTIGRRVSNGCARLTNNQIIELYEKVPLHTRVVPKPIEV